ncbi:C13 family peptidase [Microbulbifer litoralis]|uniref:C13 family peptidase n=1 Tax=Microbulbifer litoralis TaxID=2933965 RepID=UPI002027A31C|nr:C13 family peptidase [Microbulbifer sp. GX H0434]
MKQPSLPIAFLSLLALALLSSSGCEPAPFNGGTALPDGSVYSGAIENGLFHGRGQLSWPDGSEYQGEFTRGRISGQGRYVYADDCIYEGEFLNGNFNGEGRYECGGTVWQGEFEQGELLQGSVNWAAGDSYTGAFQDWEPHGRGHRITADGAHYEGTFEYGYLVQGNYRDEQGYRYQGGFEYGYYNGEGKLTQPDGTTISATFEYGEANGEGVRTHQTGDGEPQEERGYFVSGRYYASEKAWRNSGRQQQAAVEARLYSEGDRLQSAFSSLAPQRPGVRDVYALIVGGDGTSPVFTKEVDWVAQRLGGVLDIDGRQLRLSNGSDDRLPLATRTSVRESLKALDAVMDPEEDLLFVHLVSHGDDNGDFMLDERKLPLNDLSAADGKQWLDELGARHQWIIVSACYSGLWKQALASPERAIFTSAAPDRTSFGCGGDSQRTWFSAALYGEALDNGVGDPAAWFRAANARVTEMEKEQGIEEDAHSLPQHAVGARFLNWWQQ